MKLKWAFEILGIISLAPMLYNLAFYNHFSKRIGSVQILSEGHAFRDWEREHIEKLAQLLDKVLLKRAPSQVCYDPLQIYL